MIKMIDCAALTKAGFGVLTRRMRRRRGAEKAKPRMRVGMVCSSSGGSAVVVEGRATKQKAEHGEILAAGISHRKMHRSNRVYRDYSGHSHAND
jgi:hypothetical protein